ncbi:DUF262 domain-containing protein [Capnocytophaga sp. G2]|uniref:DUF262 domain-containing protein n=1 Tax=Capnocytophaga sp. G2 TaxID=3110695 RepID=UPI002B48B924|nr:DUF262 domain-containing protein [Capnocytophaga sp. G2]MEB3005347.1 DUF262 domain-containing protein [Capnocytophaga sp. G2]
MEFNIKGVLDIKGCFFVPDYQRGYRWREEEVKQLLDDIYENGEKNYYLQPIVVRRKGGNYELIDGQQRLTTIYLILSCIKEILPKTPINYQITYETRQETYDFLREIDLGRKNENIDFFFIANAYTTIRQWFKVDDSEKDSMGTAIDFYRQLKNFVKVIWYEVDEDISGVGLFTRLNIGRIPLTNSELVRALFLSRNSNLTPAEQLEIAAEWDNIQKELHQPSFWAFLTNYQSEDYPNRIDLLFDLMAGGKSKDNYATFFFFNNKIKQGEKKQELWKEIVAYFSRLREWYENREIFHKVGFLVADKIDKNNDKTLIHLLKETEEKKKDELLAYLDSQITETLKDTDLDTLSYQDKTPIQRVLLLFNVLSVMENKDKSLRFPFDKYKDKNITWSLEHIHAQNAVSLNTTEKRKEWLKIHKEALSNIGKEGQIINRIEELEAKNPIEGVQFDRLQKEIFTLLSTKENDNYLDSLSNMALLNTNNNAALNSSVFEVKRRKIIEMDKEGAYIPYCTRMVFLKYYTENPTNMHFWGADDRKAYEKAIRKMLTPYLNTKNSQA